MAGWVLSSCPRTEHLAIKCRGGYQQKGWKRKEGYQYVNREKDSEREREKKSGCYEGELLMAIFSIIVINENIIINNRKWRVRCPSPFLLSLNKDKQILIILPEPHLMPISMLIPGPSSNQPRRHLDSAAPAPDQKINHLRHSDVVCHQIS